MRRDVPADDARQAFDPRPRSRRAGAKIGVVDHPAGLVSLFDDEFRRTLAPSAADELAVRLIHDAAPHYPDGPGPVSSTL